MSSSQFVLATAVLGLSPSSAWERTKFLDKVDIAVGLNMATGLSLAFLSPSATCGHLPQPGFRRSEDHPHPVLVLGPAATSGKNEAMGGGHGLLLSGVSTRCIRSMLFLFLILSNEPAEPRVFPDP